MIDALQISREQAGAPPPPPHISGGGPTVAGWGGGCCLSCAQSKCSPLTAAWGLLDRMLLPLPADSAELTVGTFLQINLIGATVSRAPLPLPLPHPQLTHSHQLLCICGNNSYVTDVISHLHILKTYHILVGRLAGARARAALYSVSEFSQSLMVFLWLLSVFCVLQMILHSPNPGILPPFAIC